MDECTVYGCTLCNYTGLPKIKISYKELRQPPVELNSPSTCLYSSYYAALGQNMLIQDMMITRTLWG